MAVFGISIEGKPWYYGLGLGLVLAAALVWILDWRFFSDMRGQIAAKDRNLEQLEAKIKEGRTAQQKLPQFREEVRRLETELDKLLRILPARKNTPDLLRRVRTLAEQGDFVLQLFESRKQVDKEFYTEWPIKVKLQGTYHNLALLFDRVSRFPRIVNVEQLTVRSLRNREATAGRTIAAEFIAKTFVYKEGAVVDEEGEGEDLP